MSEGEKTIFLLRGRDKAEVQGSTFLCCFIETSSINKTLHANAPFLYIIVFSTIVFLLTVRPHEVKADSRTSAKYI